MKVEWWWSDGGGPSHLLYSDTEEVGGLDTRCCLPGVLEWTAGWELCSGLYTPRITGCQEMSSCLLLVAKILAGGQDRSSCLIFGD